MLRTSILVLALLIPATAVAQTVVQPYVRSDGTYVRPHLRTTPDNNPYNNYSPPRTTGGGLFAPAPQPRVNNPVRSQDSGLFWK